jgi:pyruvate/2-oxoglutarate dehydrogenase complex dihydrolipoamide acyltransferase (E2) component
MPIASSLYDIARSLRPVAKRRAPANRRPPRCKAEQLTISSLGGIGGTAFTPIINAPEVAILGVSRSSLKPVFENGGFVPRLMLPLVAVLRSSCRRRRGGARFIVHLAKLLADPQACCGRAMSRSRSVPISATSRTCGRSSRCSSKQATRVADRHPLITLETDKATMDVPSPVGRHVADVHFDQEG